MGTRVGGLKARDTNYKLHGEDFYRRIGRTGGIKKVKKGFAMNRELAIECGKKGGKISKRGRTK